MISVPFIIVTTDMSCSSVKAGANLVGFLTAEAI